MLIIAGAIFAGCGSEKSETGPKIEIIVQYYSIGLADENKIVYKIATIKDENGDDQYVRTESREFFVTKEKYDELMHIK